MSVKSTITSQLGTRLAPRVAGFAPELTAGFVSEGLQRAIGGFGPLPSAAAAAEKQLREQHGDVDRAIHEVIENNVRLAGAQGFITNLGGIVTAALTIPANISGLAVLQCRMVAGIAHLRGYDLQDPRTENAIMVSLLGEDVVADMVKAKKVPAPPMALATAPHYDAGIDQLISGVVAADMITRIAGKRLATTVGRRIPIVGGGGGRGAGAFATGRTGGYADGELLPRARR